MNNFTNGSAIMVLVFVLHLVAAVPAWWLWNTLAPIYFSQLPKVYLSIPFRDFVGLIWLAAIARCLIFGGFSTKDKA